MKTKFALVLALSALVSACGDGVPKVDIHGTIVELKPTRVQDGWHLRAEKVRMINVDGKQMPLSEFLQTYCQDKKAVDSATCSRGYRISHIDSSSGPKESLPAGL